MGKAVTDIFQDEAWESSMCVGDGVFLDPECYVMMQKGEFAMGAVSGGSADFLIKSAYDFDLDG